MLAITQHPLVEKQTERLGLDPIRMNWMARRDVEAAIRLGGATVVAVQDGWLGDGSRVGREQNLTYIATR